MKNSRKIKAGKRNLMTPLLFHTAAGLVISVLSVLAFLEPVRLALCFPGIFLLSAMVCLADGLENLREWRAKRTESRAALFLLPAGAFLLGMAVLAAVTAL